MRTGTPFIDSLVLSFFENIRMVMSAKIELCVIRQILLNLIFLMTDYNLTFFRCLSEGEIKNLQVRIFIPDDLTESRGT
jgi:hypothetical protein